MSAEETVTATPEACQAGAEPTVEGLAEEEEEGQAGAPAPSFITQVSREQNEEQAGVFNLEEMEEVVSSIDHTLAEVTPNVETEEDIERELRGCLGRRLPKHRNKKTLVLDLDETLVHSSFKEVPNADFIVPVNFEGVIHKVYVMKRKGTNEFLEICSELYEIVLFTASLSKYAEPLLERLDSKNLIDHKLYRENCTKRGFTYIKDLGVLGRRLEDLIIIDNSPQSFLLHMTNAMGISSWYGDPDKEKEFDTALIDIIPCMQKLARVPDVTQVLDARRISYQALIEYGRR